MSSTLNLLVVGFSSVIRRDVSAIVDGHDGLSIEGSAPNFGLAAEKLHHAVVDCVLLVDKDMTFSPEDIDDFCEFHPLVPVMVAIPTPRPGILTNRTQVSFTVVAACEDWVAVAAHALVSEVLELVHPIPAVAHQTSHAPKIVAARQFRPKPRIIAIGSSTGGPTALEAVLSGLPADFDIPVVICQHIPKGFTDQLAFRLSTVSPLEVTVLDGKQHLGPGQAFLAPGDHHAVAVNAAGWFSLDTGPPENSVIPSVDVLFRSVAKHYGPTVLAVILTGMGSDGLRGVRELAMQGSAAIVQDEASSVVWGMPGSVANAGLASEILDLSEVAPAIVRLSSARSQTPSGAVG